MNTCPIQLDSPNDKGRTLVRVDAHPDAHRTASWLQELLFNHPELLPVDEFDDSFGPPISIGREVHNIDNLFVSPEGGLTIVETKLWRNPEKHREVVAQVIDYAKDLVNWDYDDLDEAVKASYRRRGEQQPLSLEERVRPWLQEDNIEFDEFQSNLIKNLKAGSFLLLVVGDRISPNVAMLSKAVHGHPGLDFTLGLVEMRLYAHSDGLDWPIIVVPDVVGRTVEETRAVVRVEYQGEHQPRATVAAEEFETRKVNPRLRLDWRMFIESVPPDFVPVYEAALQEWNALGGSLLYTKGRAHWQVPFNGANKLIIKSSDLLISVLTSTAFKRQFEGQHKNLYEEYVEQLRSSETAYRSAQNGKMYIYCEDRLKASDAQVVLDAGIWLAKRLRALEGDTAPKSS